MTEPGSQKFAACPHCPDGELHLRLGYVAQPPDENTLVTEMGGGWNSASLPVRRSLVAFCTNAPERCAMRDVAAVGLDTHGNTVSFEPGARISQVLTDPELIVLTQDQIDSINRDQ